MELDDVGGNMQTKSPSNEATSVEFTGLVAGTQYTVRVFTLSGGQRSVKMEGKFYTSKSGGSVYFLNDFVYIQHCYQSYNDMSRHWRKVEAELNKIISLLRTAFTNIAIIT